MRNVARTGRLHLRDTGSRSEDADLHLNRRHDPLEIRDRGEEAGDRVVLPDHGHRVRLEVVRSGGLSGLGIESVDDRAVLPSPSLDVVEERDDLVPGRNERLEPGDVPLVERQCAPRGHRRPGPTAPRRGGSRPRAARRPPASRRSPRCAGPRMYMLNGTISTRNAMPPSIQLRWTGSVGLYQGMASSPRERRVCADTVSSSKSGDRLQLVERWRLVRQLRARRAGRDRSGRSPTVAGRSPAARRP